MLKGRHTYLGCKFTTATTFHVVAPNTCGASLQNLLHITLLAPTILMQTLNFLKIRAPLLLSVLINSYGRNGLAYIVSSCDVVFKNIKQTLTIRLLMSYIYGAPILDVSRSHTTTQHSR